jgi:hypothetical protein
MAVEIVEDDDHTIQKEVIVTMGNVEISQVSNTTIDLSHATVDFTHVIGVESLWENNKHTHRWTFKDQAITIRPRKRIARLIHYILYYALYPIHRGRYPGPPFALQEE